MLPARITVFAVDLSGSGLSEGEYVTLGAREVLDVEAIVHHLRDQGGHRPPTHLHACSCFLFARRRKRRLLTT